MKRFLITIVCLGLATVASASEIHFLALHLPQNLHQSLDAIEHDVQQRVKQQMPSAAAHIQYHTRGNRHISLVRFDHLTPGEQQAYRHAITDAVKQVKWGHSHHPFDLSSRVRGFRKLHVTKDGWIVVHVDPSDTLTHFAHAVRSAIHHKRPQDRVQTDLPDRAHISIGKADLGKVSVDKLRYVLEGHTYHVKCDRFEVHNIHLQKAVGHLQYKEIGPPFKVPAHP